MCIEGKDQSQRGYRKAAQGTGENYCKEEKEAESIMKVGVLFFSHKGPDTNKGGSYVQKNDHCFIGSGVLDC